MQTVTYIYDDPSLAAQAVQALEAAGFTSNEISVLRQDGDVEAFRTTDDSVADGATTGASVGLAAGAGAGLLASLGLIAIPGIGPLVAAGVLATTLAAGAAGAVGGGIIGALIDYGVSEEEAPLYAESLSRGGTLVSVRAEDNKIPQAELIMQRFSPIDFSERDALDESETGVSEVERKRYRA